MCFTSQTVTCEKQRNIRLAAVAASAAMTGMKLETQYCLFLHIEYVTCRCLPHYHAQWLILFRNVL